MDDDRLPTVDVDGGGSAQDAVMERARGCLLGQMVGDALGSMVKFMSGVEIRTLYPSGPRTIGPSIVHGTIAGQPTDELPFALARSLLARGGYDEESVAGAYVDWLASGPFDVGTTSRRALAAMRTARARRGESLAAAGRAAASRSSQANGAMMRQSPLAIFGWRMAAGDLAAIVAADTTLTHPNQVCVDASSAFIVALAAVVRDGMSGRAAYEYACAWDRKHGHSSSVTAALEAASSRVPSFETNEGHVLIALQNAFYQALHAPSFEDGLVETVRGGGDTDTNAAVAGALLGAIDGLSALPEQWRTVVLECRPARDTSGVRHPRPPIYWPVETPDLADQLLHLGAELQAHRLEAPAAPGAAAPDLGGATPRAAAAVRHGSLKSRFRGALLGGAIGDALGRSAAGSYSPQYAPPWRVTEYIPWRGYEDGPRGSITDDTQLTMVVAESLLREGRLNPEDLARRLVDWLPVGRGKGRGTTAAVLRLQSGTPWYLASDESMGTGAAMRVAPIGLLRYHDPRLVRMEATLSALPTHRLPMAVAGAVAMAVATAWLVTRESDQWSARDFISTIQTTIAGLEPSSLAEPRGSAPSTILRERIGDVVALLDEPPATAMSSLYSTAAVLEGIPAAFYCFLRSPGDMEQSLLLAANTASNTDTVAAMTGTLGGALGGEEALPKRLLEDLEYRERLIELADALHEQAQK